MCSGEHSTTDLPKSSPDKGGNYRSTLVALTIKKEEEMPQKKFKCFSQRDF
jgi:hypothetical protein